MISRGKQPTAAEKQWRKDVVDFAQCSSWLTAVYGQHCQNVNHFEIDHIIGAQAKCKINGVSVKVGEFAIMPIPFEIHSITSNHPLNRTLRPAKFRHVIGHEKRVFKTMIEEMRSAGYTIPFDDDVLHGILRR